MTVDASIPKALYQANIDLALRIAALLQENGKQWFDLFAEEAGTRLDEGMSSLGALAGELSLEKLAALPADAAAQLLQLDVGRWQAMISHAVENQTRFSDGLQEALREWQAACSEAFDAVGAAGLQGPASALSALPGFSEVAMSFQRFMAQAVPSVGAVYRATAGLKASRADDADTSSASVKSPEPARTSADAPKKNTAPAPAPRRAKPPAKEAAAKTAAAKATKAKKPATKAGAASTGAAKTAKPVGKTAAVAKKASTRRPPRKKAGGQSPAPVPPPSPLPALVTTPRKTAKARNAKPG